MSIGGKVKIGEKENSIRAQYQDCSCDKLRQSLFDRAYFPYEIKTEK